MPGMSTRSRARAIGRAALARVPGRFRTRALGAVGGRIGLTGAEIGLVSVVVVPEDGDRVEDCLASVRGQTHALLDVVVSPVGPAAVELPDDPRFRTIAPSATPYDAVPAAIAAASGRYVVLVRGCDQLESGLRLGPSSSVGEFAVMEPSAGGTTAFLNYEATMRIAKEKFGYEE